jgi:hypothetical protein
LCEPSNESAVARGITDRSQRYRLLATNASPILKIGQLVISYSKCLETKSGSVLVGKCTGRIRAHEIKPHRMGSAISKNVLSLLVD